MIEYWRAVEGYGNAYEVSSLGQVRSKNRLTTAGSFKPGVLLVLRVKKKGYICVKLSHANKAKLVYVHRIVARAFLANDMNRPQVNHRNGVKADNRPENLEWCTNQENAVHAVKVLGRVNATRGRSSAAVDFRPGKRVGGRYKPIALTNGSRTVTFGSMTEAAAYVGVRLTYLCDMKSGKYESCKGWSLK